MTDIPPLSLGPWLIESGRAFYALIWATALGAAWLISNLLRTRAGRAMRAVKNAGSTAASFGIHVGRTRLVAFLCAAVLASVSGWIYAHMLRFLNPTPFSLGLVQCLGDIIEIRSLRPNRRRSNNVTPIAPASYR